MSLTLALSVPAAAARLGRSERTIWRQIRTGDLTTKREGRRVLVLVDADDVALTPGQRHAVGEATVSYGTARAWQVGPWPFTRDLVDRHRRAKLARRRAAIETMKELTTHVRPDPDGLTFQDYLDADREHPRALDGGDAADLALEALARVRRTHR